MHVPDGFLSPKIYVPGWVATAGLWVIGLRRVRASLGDTVVPRLAVLTALSFVLMMVTLPLPGGTSVHATGIALLAIGFGIWTSFLCVSLVLALQALLFGAGGVTSLPLNALALGLVGSAVARGTYVALAGVSRRAALFTAAWLSVNVAAAIVATTLGLQPALAHRPDGTPLFFPFGLAITLPAILIPHALVGVGEGVLTILVHELITRLGREEETA